MPVVGPCEKALDQDTTAIDQAVHAADTATLLSRGSACGVGVNSRDWAA